MEWKAVHILIKDRGLANEILKQLQQGADFSRLAQQYSTCPSKSKGGDLGWFGEGAMVPAFEDACKRLNPGALSQIVQTQFGFHIIKLTGRR